jgi:serine/threonine-protein kinase
MVGVGGMGRVYCAEQVALGRTVAVKVVHPHLANDELAAARFLNEARAASRLSHPNSVAIFDFGRTDDGQPYIVMEYLRGRDLGRVAQTEGPLPLRRVVDVLRQTLAALDEAHALGIVHRDLKPDNIVLEPMRSGLDFVKVVDFGLAKLVGGEAPVGRGALTRPGLVCGTPEYMSPEQGRGDELDGRSDLYSVGIVLFELLSGCQPFVADSAPKTLLLHLTEPPPDPRDVAPDRAIPAAFAELAMRALAKSREDRFQTAAAFADALEQALLDGEGRSTLEPPPSTAVRCGHCGGLSPLGQKFCGDCGASIHPTPSSSLGPGAIGNARRFVDLRTAPTSVAPSQGALKPLPFVGRDDVVRWLDARRDEGGSMPAAAHLVGDLGMGRTRLLTEVFVRWREKGDAALRVGPDPTWAKIGDASVIAAIAGLAGDASGGPPQRPWDRASSNAAKGLELLFGPSPASMRADASERRRAVADALRWAIVRASERAAGHRVILAVDDLDFVDGSSRNAFVDVLTAMPAVPFLFVVSYTPRARPISNESPGEVFRLEPLAYEAFGSWLSPRLAARDSPLAPLHLEQLLAWARETPEPPPERLADIVTRRADRLAPDARHALYAIAVWGDDATHTIVRGLLPPGTDAAAAVSALEDARWVTSTEGALGIAHPLVRRIVFSTIPAGLKRDIFLRAAELRPTAPLEVRARQSMYGDSALEALALLDALSAKRTAHGDVDGSISALRHALDLARRELHRDELDDPVGAILTFSRKLGEALAAARRWSDADGVLREALDVAPPTSEHRVHLLGAMAQVASARRHTDEARRYLDEAIRVARQSDARELLPMLERLDKALAVA